MFIDRLEVHTNTMIIHTAHSPHTYRRMYSICTSGMIRKFYIYSHIKKYQYKCKKNSINPNTYKQIYNK